jgi:hypothetical protein
MMEKRGGRMANTRKTDCLAVEQYLLSSIIHCSLFIVNSAACGGFAPPPPAQMNN